MSGHGAGDAGMSQDGLRAASFHPAPVHPALTPCLSFVAGCCDAFAFIALDRLFVAHITGNLIIIGADLWIDTTNVLAKIIAIPVFIAAAATTMLLVRRAHRRGYDVLRAALYVEATLLLLFFLGCLYSEPSKYPLDWDDTVAGMLGVAALGTQAALMRLALPATAPTNFMTGTAVQVTLDAINCAGYGVRDIPPEELAMARQRVFEGLRRLAGFVGGVAFAGVAFFTVGVWTLALPFAIVLCLAILHRRPN